MWWPPSAWPIVIKIIFQRGSVPSRHHAAAESPRGIPCKRADGAANRLGSSCKSTARQWQGVAAMRFLIDILPANIERTVIAEEATAADYSSRFSSAQMMSSPKKPEMTRRHITASWPFASFNRRCDLA